MIRTVILLMAAAFTSGAIAQNSLVKNGSFENELINWNGDVANITSFDYKAGKKAMMINQFVGTDWKGMDQIVTIPKGTYAIQFSVWVKTEAIEGGKNPWNKGIMSLEFMSGSKGVGNENVAEVGGSTPWTIYKKTILVPEKAKQFRLMLALAQTMGTIIFDDIKAVPLSEESYLKLIQDGSKSKNEAMVSQANVLKAFSNGDFEQGMQNWSGNADLETADQKEGRNALNITSSVEEWKGIDQSFDVVEGSKSITISGWLKAKGIQQGSNSWNNGVFIAEFTSDGNSKIIDDQLVGSVANTTDWIFFEKELDIPEKTQKIRLMLALSACKGTLLADGIAVQFK